MKPFNLHKKVSELLSRFYLLLIKRKTHLYLMEGYSLTTGMSSDIGCLRKRNEDSVAIVPLKSKNSMTPGLLAIIADGMGGHKAGNCASELAVKTIMRIICSTDILTKKILDEAVQTANRAIFYEALQNDDCVGMGTTVTALLFFEGKAWMAHVGDSRLYRLRKNELVQLSEDHTLVATMERNGLISAEQAKSHPNRNILNRAIGTHLSLEVMLAAVDLALGDIFLLCSDGLHDLVSGEEIREKLLNYPLQVSCKHLVDLARNRGGYDNISVVAVCCEKPSNLEYSSPSTSDSVIISNA